MEPVVNPLVFAGLGSYLPAQVRENGWWPRDVVSRWVESQGQGLAHPESAFDVAPSRGVMATLEAMRALAGDPFHGVRTRRVMVPGETTLDMEVHASMEALRDASAEPAEIDLLIQQSTGPDDPTVPQGCALHHRLGLPTDCFTMTMEAGCNSFVMQLMVAAQFLATGMARAALIVQSTSYSRQIPPEEPYSPWFGDGATAVVLRRGDPTAGILGASHRTDGRFYRAYTSTNPVATACHAGTITVDDRVAMRRLLLSLADLTRGSIHEALRVARLGPSDVNFYASHHATVWFRPVTQAHAGLDRARFVDICEDHGSLNACNIPFTLARAVESGRLEVGDVVVMCSGGAGMTWSALVVRWGR